METEAGRTQKGKIAQMFHGISGMGAEESDTVFLANSRETVKRSVLFDIKRL